MQVIEYTCQIFRNYKWESVGTKGDLQHAHNEMIDWEKECPDDKFRIAERFVGDWHESN